MKNTQRNRTKLQTKRLALSAILASLGVVILYLGSIIEVLDLSMAAIASLLTVLAVIEMGGAYPYLIYGVTAVLSFLLLPNKFPAVLYLLFAGIYPMLKARFERLHYIVAWVLKISCFGTALLLVITVSNYVLHLPDTGLGFSLGVFALGTLTFVIYDIALSRLITFYLVKLRSRLGLKNYFEN